jgi:hypothetical protein
MQSETQLYIDMVREVLYYQQLHVSALHMAIISLEYN